MKNGNGKHATERIELGEYIVADPKICHGKPTFKGTRIMVWQVLEDVAEGRSWDFICNRRWGGRIPLSAVAEAVRLAQEALLERYGLAARRPVRRQSEPAFA
ncbi:MAG TPA: DUF433 domain-containing protein [Verrucomicrobiae bacterium]|nr:DUF433 domain-containing protein [Verrucomicrobiae bacterium]